MQACHSSSSNRSWWVAERLAAAAEFSCQATCRQLTMPRITRWDHRKAPAIIECSRVRTSMEAPPPWITASHPLPRARVGISRVRYIIWVGRRARPAKDRTPSVSPPPWLARRIRLLWNKCTTKEQPAPPPSAATFNRSPTASASRTCVRLLAPAATSRTTACRSLRAASRMPRIPSRYSRKIKRLSK